MGRLAEPRRAARRLVLMRHGQTDWNAQFRFQGRTDIPLNAEGRAQAQAAAPFVAAYRPSRIVASPLQRALVTAQAVGERAGLEVETDARFQETYLGEWEGMVNDDVVAQDPTGVARWRAGEPGFRAGRTGESKLDVARRASDALEEIMRTAAPGSTTLVVMHGGAAAALIGALMHLDPRDWPRFQGLGNCAWSVLREDLVGVNRSEIFERGAAGVGDVPQQADEAPDGETAGFADISWRLEHHNLDAGLLDFAGRGSV